MDKKVSFGARVKEGIRKFIVGLKHRPHNIPLAMLVVTFLCYSLNLSHISQTTATINASNMGLCEFVTMLFSMLSLVCFGNSFPRRKPVNKPMYALMMIMFAAIIAADVFYISSINSSVISVTSKTAFIAYAYRGLTAHVVLLAVSVVLILLLPVYAKLIRKINTSIEVEAGEEMAAIDISGED